MNPLLEGNPATPLILLGDVNHVPEAQTSLLLTSPNGSEIGTGGFDRPDKGDDAHLFNPALPIAPERRFSRMQFGSKELLDQIFASDELLPVGADHKGFCPRERQPRRASLRDRRRPSAGDRGLEG